MSTASDYKTRMSDPATCGCYHVQPATCFGQHAYADKCPGLLDHPGQAGPPPLCWQHSPAPPWRQIAFDVWQYEHLNPCECGSDTAAVNASCEIHCTHCGWFAASLNWRESVRLWQEQNPKPGPHPMVEYCEAYATFPKKEKE